MIVADRTRGVVEIVIRQVAVVAGADLEVVLPADEAEVLDVGQGHEANEVVVEARKMEVVRAVQVVAGTIGIEDQFPVIRTAEVEVQTGVSPVLSTIDPDHVVSVVRNVKVGRTVGVRNIARVDQEAQVKRNAVKAGHGAEV